MSTTGVCPEYSPADVQEWIDVGQIPELTRVTSLTLIDLDSGHWPMYSCPERLAETLTAVRRGDADDDR